MPRIIILLLFMLVLGSGAVLAQQPEPVETPIPEGTAVPDATFADAPTADAPTAMPTAQPLPQSIFLQPIDPQTIDTPLIPVGGNPGGDTCDLAANVVFLNTAIGGVTPNVELKTVSDTDPTLSCMWGNPGRPNGYRTVWYKFTAVTNIIVTINTETSNYDTVVGVFTPSDTANACTTLAPVACSDDFTGFSSVTTFTAVQGQTYYVVIADWSAASSGVQNLNIFMQPQPADPNWELMGNSPNGQVTHHDTAVDPNGYIYVIGGQTNVLGSPSLSNKLYRYNPVSANWTEMPQIPGLGLTDLTSATLNGQIFVPGGDDGSPGVFNATHYVYHITGNFWSFAATPPMAVGWSQAVAAADGSGYYLLGGVASKPVFDDNADVRSNVYFYDLAANTWLPRPSMTTPRFGHTAVRLGDQICVVGGVNDANQLMGGGECLRPFSAWQTIASLNIPRYGAESAVGPDGRWYIFGGTTVINNVHTPVSATEVYDPAHPSTGWSILNVPYDLVDPNTVFARAFPGGEFWGNHLYAIGGNHSVPSLDEYQVVPLVQRLYIPSYKLYFPYVAKSGVQDFDDNMGAAKGLPPNVWAGGNFSDSRDFYDFYYFDLPAVSGVTVRVQNIPSGSDYDLYLFSSNKLLWSSSTNPGNLAESVALTLAPGRYYALVQRVYGSSQGSWYEMIVMR